VSLTPPLSPSQRDGRGDCDAASVMTEAGARAAVKVAKAEDWSSNRAIGRN